MATAVQRRQLADLAALAKRPPLPGATLVVDATGVGKPVVEHLKRLPGFTPTVFPWNHNRRTLDTEFMRIQHAAKIKRPDGSEGPIHLPCPERHEHTDACHVYGFHDLRRAFATMNADKLTGDALQKLMRHKSYATTQVYINLARQMDEAVDSLHVPDVLRRKAEGDA
jgi:integrase